MIGMIVTGHGRFADGITSSLNIIAGNPSNYFAINFDGTDVAGYEHDLKKALEELSKMEKIIILCDIAGGTPFKTAAMLTLEDERIKVVGGSNVPLVCEIALSREFAEDFDSFFENAVENSKESVVIL